MRIFTVLFLVFVLSGISIAQIGSEIYEFNVQGNGARSAGMGYAFTGLADDATAITVNPAGIAQLGTFEFSLVTRLDIGTGSISLSPEYPVSDLGLTLTRASNFDFNFASVVLPLPLGNMNAAAGLAYRRYVNLNIETTLSADGFEDDVFEKEGGIQTITGAAGFEVMPNLFVGGAANLFFGSSEIVGYYADNWMIDYSGFNLEGGFLFKPVEKFSIGVKATLPWTLGRSHSNPDYYSYTRDVSMPFEASFGATIRPFPELTFAADFRLRPLSKATYKPKYTEGPNQNNQYETEKDFWENLNSFHFGAELVVSMGNMAIPLRAGFYTFPTVSREYNPGDLPFPQFFSGEQISGIVITGGGGLATGPLVLDLSMELGIINDYDYGYYIPEIPVTLPLVISQGFFRINMGAVVHLGDLMN